MRDFAASIPAFRYGPCSVVIGRDAASLRDAAPLSEEVAQAGQVALDSFVNRIGIDVGYRAAGVDPLRTCAWLGAALELGRPDPQLFEHVLRPYRLPVAGSGVPVTEGP